jgi:DNA polymerase-1
MANVPLRAITGYRSSSTTHILETEGEVPEEFEYFKDVCVNYAGKDVERTILLHGVFQEVMDDLDVRKGYEREKRLLQVIYRTEQDGITLSEKKRVAKVKALTKAKDEHALVAQKFADKISKKEVNLRSPPDLIDVIYKKLKMPITKATPKTGQPSTKAEIFADFYDLTKDPKGGHYNRAASAFFLNLILAKKNEKAAKDLENYKSYSLPCPNHKDYIVIYPSLNQSGTSTVRFSCSNPNGQNVSKVSLVEIGKDKEEFPGPKIRDVYSPPPGKIWYAIDYNQLELRVFAADSEEHSLIQALDDGYDFHGFVSTQIFKKPIEKISKQERRIAKNTDFAIIFGAGEAKVNETAGIPNAYKMFAGLFPNVHTHMKKVIDEVRRDGFVRTMDGYRLVIPNEPYKAVNYRAQGTAGSIIKNAMIAIDQDGLVDWIDSRIVLQIHDELIIEFTKDSPKHTPAAVYTIMKAMEQAGADLGINTPVSCERIETDWGHGEEVKVTKTKITPIKKAA